MASTVECLTNFFNAVKANDLQKTIEILKTKAVDVNTVDGEEQAQTALHIAAAKGHIDMLRCLVDEHEADMNICNKSGKVATQVAYDNYHANIVKFLVERNPAHMRYGERILNDKHVDELMEAAKVNDVPKIIDLIEKMKVNVDSIDKGAYGRTALHVAACAGHEPLVMMLVDKYKADINYSDEIGDLAIHMAADNGHLGIVKFLVERKSDGIEDVADLLS